MMQSQTTTWTTSADGFGPVRIGMTLEQAENVTGKTMISYGLSRAELLAEPCGYVKFKNDSTGVEFMIDRGTIVRVDVTRDLIATDRGVRVGDTEERVKSLYDNRLSIEPAKYEPNGHFLTYPPRRSRNRIIFETDGKHVTYIRAGRLPEVKLVERCG